MAFHKHRASDDIADETIRLAEVDWRPRAGFTNKGG
jgi:hypothetical protein